jgi:uncharacterized membrane protein (UPF0127 family)
VAKVRIAALALGLALVSCRSGLDRVTIGVGSEEFTVEVARTPAQQEHGLMERRHLGEREGMIFVYLTDRRMTFWMKNTLIPLSIAFLSSEGEILEIEDMKPLDLTPIVSKRSARYALEVNKGAFERAGARAGDRIRLPESFP